MLNFFASFSFKTAIYCVGTIIALLNGMYKLIDITGNVLLKEKTLCI